MLNIRVWAGVLVLVIGLIGGPARGQAGAPLAADAVENWADEFFNTAWAQRRFSAASVVFVQDGEIVFANGYGFHDAVTGQPLDMDRSGFHLGSIGKVFTATAIGQLLESGQIESIDDPANRYLTRFQLPDAPNRPVSIRDLLTHQAGFEDWFYGIINEHPVETPQSGEFISRFMPTIVSDAGEHVVYSSFGIAMLGAIVEDVSGLTFRDYVATRIFRPLGMEHSQIPYDPVAPDSMVNAYAFYPNGEPALKPRVITFPFFAPAGVALTSPRDFGRFMLAQLGSLDGEDVLGEPLRARLHGELTRNHPAMTGIAMTFGRLEYNQESIIYHAGNGPGFDSFMALFPERNAGVFFVTAGGPPTPALIEGLAGSARLQSSPDIEVGPWLGAQEVMSRFLLDRFGPSQPETVLVGDLAPYEGVYRGVRRSYTTWEAFLGLMMNPPSRVVASDSGLIVDGRGPYRPIGNDTFQRDDDATGVRKIAFSLDAAGRAGQMFHFPGLDVAHRIDGMHIGQFLPAFLVGIVTVFSGMLCVFYPFGPAGPAGLSRLKWMPPAMLVVLVAGICAVVMGHPPEEDPFFGIGRSFLQPWRFAALNIATNLIALGSVVLAVVSVLAWKQRYWGNRWGGWVVRSHFTILCLGWLALLPILVQLNLIGWHWPG